MPEDIDQVRSLPKRSFWEHHLERWQKSGLSQQTYCHTHQLKPHQFYYWRRCILKPEPEVSFLPVTLPVDTLRKQQLMRILMPNGYALELEGRAETEQLERLVNIVAAL